MTHLPHRIAITVTGRVQGVFFRASAHREAERLALAGLARNQPDGSVYLEVEGPEPALEQFLAWCHTGPDLAQVESASHTTIPATGQIGFGTH
jgi:acylphosphatase